MKDFIQQTVTLRILYTCTQTQADASDEEAMRAVSAGTRDSERPVSSTHGADVATDIGEGNYLNFK